MNDHSCHKANVWTCRQPPQPSSSAEIPGMRTQAQAFLPGLVQDYLGQQPLPTTKELAVVFVDIADSASTLLHQSPAYALAMVQYFSAIVTDIALAHCGDVKDYEGDGALLYFGSLRQAAQAALAIRDALLTEQRAGALTVHARISLNVGEVTIGVIGSAHRRAVALLGPSVHLAARLLKEVTPGGIIATQTVVERLQHEAPLLAQGFHLRGTCMAVRGFEEQCVTAYHIPADTETLTAAELAPTSCCGGARTTALTAPIAEQRQKLIQHGPSRLQPVACRPAQPREPNSQLPSPNVFLPEGEFWTLSFAGTTCRLKDARGLHFIAHLLQQPQQEVHVLTLITVGANLGAESGETSSFLDASRSLDHMDGVRDAGDMLDPQARAAYKQRLSELREELAEAQQFHDLGRSERLAAEIDFLAHELARAVGLGGRLRRMGSPAERARVNITRAIKIALRKISEHHPALSQHLATTIKTGTYCTYIPDARLPITWQG
jgi:class 3 adenylate cyclase